MPRAKRKLVKAQPQHEPYALYGGNKEFFYCNAPEVLLAGCAGSGKSVSALTKLAKCCELTPGIRCLIVRKTRESLTESGLVTLEQKILSPGSSVLRGPMRKLRSSYRFPNGSEIVVGGMDKASKTLSTEYDLIYVMEATELTENDWEMLLRPLRNGKFAYHQLLADCNPDSPQHWLKKRCDSGRCVLIESRHEDNPYLFDQEKKEYTEAGRSYLSKLDAMTGHRLQRLRYGKWSQAEGVVYPEWDRRLHVIDPADLPGGGPYPPLSWDRYWSIDFGYSVPFCWHCWAVDGDRRAYLYRELYYSATLVEDHAKRILSLWQAEAEYWAKARKIPMDSAVRMLEPQSTVCDPEGAQERATLEKHLGVPTTAARKFVTKGIQAVSERLRVQADGKPRLFVLSNALVGLRDGHPRDPALEEAKKPIGLIEEMDGYVLKPGTDEPLKQNDHACFVAGTLVATDRGEIPIQDVRVGDLAWTRQGYRRVTASGMVRAIAPVSTITFSDGRTLTGTADHPIWLPAASDFRRLDCLSYGDVVACLDGDTRWRSSNCPARARRLSEFASTASSTDDTRSPNRCLIATISGADRATSGAASRRCTETCGSITAARSQKATTSTTLTTIRSTLGSRISSASARPSITRGTTTKRAGAAERGCSISPRKSASASTTGPEPGTDQPKATPGTVTIQSECGPRGSPTNTPVNSAARRTRPSTGATHGSAPSSAKRPSAARTARTTLIEPATSAEGCSGSTGTPRGGSATLRVLGVREEGVGQPVFNLTVEGAHEYFANGVLVSNCDSMRYFIIHLDGSFSGIWESASCVGRAPGNGQQPAPDGAEASRVLRPQPRMRLHERDRRGGRLFGGGA